jgi:hypothetical protein
MLSSIPFAASTATSKIYSHSIYSRPQKTQKMSITQTYFLAHSARNKLCKEAARPDHDLRLLVGHANTLDSLMLDLANVEQEQEWWFSDIVSGARDEEEARHRHVETVVESTDELEDEAEEKPTTNITAIEGDSDIEDDDESDDDLALIRIASRHSPPELTIDPDSDSEDEQIPLSPQTTLEALSEKRWQETAATSFYDAKDTVSLSPAESEAFEKEGFFLPSRQQQTITAAY